MTNTELSPKVCVPENDDFAIFSSKPLVSYDIMSLLEFAAQYPSACLTKFIDNLDIVTQLYSAESLEVQSKIIQSLNSNKLNPNDESRFDLFKDPIKKLKFAFCQNSVDRASLNSTIAQVYVSEYVSGEYISFGMAKSEMTRIKELIGHQLKEIRDIASGWDIL